MEIKSFEIVNMKSGRKRLESGKPIDDTFLIRGIAQTLKNRNKKQYIIFMLAICTGIRKSEVIRLKVKDIKPDGIKINGVSKSRVIDVPSKFKEIIKEYIRNKGDNDYVFTKRDKREHINSSYIDNMLYEINKEFGYKYKINYSSLRKTFGYNLFWDTRDFELVGRAMDIREINALVDYLEIPKSNNLKEVLDSTFTRFFS